MSNDFSGKFLKAARMLLRLKQEDIASELDIDRRILARLELSENQKVDVVLFSRIRSNYERRGIEFIAATSTHGTGVRIKSPDNKVDDSVPNADKTAGKSQKQADRKD
jgi:transcriptional regulator with XRE-family HTH domain